MSAMHDERHEAVLRGIALGERAPDDGDWIALRATCATCRDAMEGFETTTERLDDAGAAEREEIRLAAALEADPREEAIPAAFEAIATSRTTASKGNGSDAGGRPAPAGPWRLARVLVAAGIVLALGFAVRALTSGDEPSTRDPRELDVFLGPDEAGFTLIAPGEDAAGFDRFEWTYDGVAPSGFEVSVYHGRPPHELIVSRKVEASPWILTPEERELLPAEIEWDVSVRNAFGASSVVSDSKSASRSRP